jgi:hypothetical protein
MNPKYVITTPEGYQISIEVPVGVQFGDPGTYAALSRSIAAGILDAYRTYPPQAEA